MTFGLGATRQSFDARDIPFTLSASDLAVPAKVDLRGESYNPPIWNQGALGACTAFATNRLKMFVYTKNGWHNPFVPSFLFQYYNSRRLEGTLTQDSGATLRDAFRASATDGMTAEHNWPYSDTNPGVFTTAPTPAIYANAIRHLTSQYQAVPQILTALKGSLAQGYPFVIGIEVYEPFFTAPNGDVQLPVDRSQYAGGHALCVVGYDDSTQRFAFANSWGSGWGTAGYGTLPYEYLLDPTLSFDAWTIRVQD